MDAPLCCRSCALSAPSQSKASVNTTQVLGRTGKQRRKGARHNKGGIAQACPREVEMNTAVNASLALFSLFLFALAL